MNTVDIGLHVLVGLQNFALSFNEMLWLFNGRNRLAIGLFTRVFKDVLKVFKFITVGLELEVGPILKVRLAQDNVERARRLLFHFEKWFIRRMDDNLVLDLSGHAMDGRIWN